MTREQALKYKTGDLVGSDKELQAYEDLVNKIFDDFESRTCGNCIHYDDFNESSGICTNINYSTYGIGVDAIFGCNKFERK